MATNDMAALLQSATGASIGAMEAAAAIPFIFMTPNSTDPDMTPVKTIVRAIQATLNQSMHAGLKVDGILGPQSGAALRATVPQGTEVGTEQWYKLLQYAKKGAPQKSIIPQLANMVPSAAGLGDVLSNPWVIGGAVALFILLNKKSKKRSR